MSSKTQDKIYETFVAVSGGHPASVQSWIDASERIEKPGARTGGQMRTAKPVTWRAVSTSAGTGKSTASTEGSGSSVASTVLQSVFQGVPLAGAVAGATGGTGGGGIGSTIESIASTVLKSGLGMVPLIGGLLGLFGGGSPAPPTLTKYAMPASIAFESADTGGSIGEADYDQMSLPRTYGAHNGALAAGFDWPSGTGGGSVGLAPGAGGSNSPTATGFASSGGDSSGTPAPQITVNAQAMHARWFLDHSSEIAAAVRDAMLNLNSLNDVVNDL